MARAAYDAVAADYDRLTAHHDYELWSATVVDLLGRHGLSGRRLLDAGCGTGKSAAALAARGFEVTGVDVSPAMLAVARQRLDAGVPLHAADVRALPLLGPFDAATLLDDVVNHVPGDELAAAFAALGAVLRPGGLLLFDANTLAAYRRHFSATAATEDEAGLLLWWGRTSPDMAAGGTAALTIEAFVADGSGRYARRSSHHEQHHHPPDRLRAALLRAGLELLAVYGQGFDAAADRPLDEDRHTKGLYIARVPPAAEEERR
jgi:SAM-dependent methyltransferase